MTLQLSLRWQSQLTLPGLSGTGPHFAIAVHFGLTEGKGYPYSQLNDIAIFTGPIKIGCSGQ